MARGLPCKGVFLGDDEPPLLALSCADEILEGGLGSAIRELLIFSRWTLLGRWGIDVLGGKAGPLAAPVKSDPKIS